MADRRYETLVLIHPDQGEPGSKEVTARIRALLDEQGCPISQVQDWGLRELSYPISRQRRGFYVLFEFRAEPKALTEVERNLTLMDPVMRFVSVRQDENAPPAPARHLRRPEREDGDVEAMEGEGFDGEGV